MIVATKLALGAVVWANLATAQLDLSSVNVAVNLVTVALLIGFAVPAFRSKRKDGTIKDLNDALSAKDRHEATLVQQLRDAELQKRQFEQAATFCKEKAAVWEAKYEEQHKYTAESALETVAALSEKRHAEVMSALGALTKALERAA